MSADAKASDFFVAGGTLHLDARSYVKRPADDELFELALAGEFCYVLTPRQMGKSSLMIRIAQRLQEQGVSPAILDLTSIGTDVTADQWYLSLLTQLKRRLRLSVDPLAWWQARASLGYVQRFTDFLRDVILTEIGERVVIFVDEIDTTLNLDFRDDFFAAIRAMYNARADDPEFDRLTFVLLGAASPPDLIKNRARTPFNIGQGITLQEFSRTDATVLQSELETLYPGQGEAIFARIYHWTNGHPYLTQKMCLAVAEAEDDRWTNERVDNLVGRLFLSEEARKETNLQFVQDKILTHPQHHELLSLYRSVARGKGVEDDGQSPLQRQLKLSGIVKAENGHLRIRNEIYRRAFTLVWVRENTPTNWAPIVVGISLFVTLLVLGSTFYNDIACKLWPRERWCYQSGQTLGRRTVFALAGCDDGTLFAGAQDGIYRSAPDTSGWILEHLTNRDVRGLVASPDCTLVYAAAPDYGVLRRERSSWHEVPSGDMDRPEAVALSGKVILAGGEPGLIYSLADDDHSWKKPSVFPGGRVVSLVRSDGYVYAAVWGSGVWYCGENDLDHWQTVSDTLQITHTLQAIGPLANGAPQFAGVDDGFYRWDGAQWGTGPEQWGETRIFTRTFCFVIDNGTVYAGQQNNGVLYSTDDGLTWEPMNTGFRKPPSQVRALLIHVDEDDRRWLYAGTSDGVWRYLLPNQLISPVSTPTPTPTPIKIPTETATPTPTPTPTFTPIPTPSPIPYVTHIYSVSHRTIPDWPIFLPGTPFTESWGLKSTSLGHWPEGSKLVFVRGDQMGGPDEQEIWPLPAPGERVTVSISLVAPASDGKYEGIWQVQDGDGNPISDELNVSVVVYRPIPTPIPYPSPQLAGIDVIKCSVTFRWTWSRTLAENEWFAVRVGAGTEPPHSVVWTKEYAFTHTLDAGGDYSWMIVVCRGDPAQGNCKELAASEQESFSFGGCSKPEPPPP